MKTEKKHLVISNALKAVAKKHVELSYNELRVIIALERLVARLESDSTNF